MHEIKLSSNLDVITAEINSYKQIAGQATFEIGRRLKHVKERKLAEKHGGWTEWLRNIDMSTSQADRFIKVVDELGDEKFPTSGSITLGKLYEIATLPPEERKKTHIIPSTGKIKTVDEMTVKELREVKKALRTMEKEKEEVEEKAQKAEMKIRELELQIKKMSNQMNNAQNHQEEEQLKAEIERLQNELEQARNIPPKVIEKPPADYELIKRQKQKYQTENEVLKSEVAMYKNREKDRAKWATEKMERLKNEAYTFEAEVNAFLEKVALYGYLASQINNADDAVKHHYNAALEKLDQFLADMRFRMKGNKGIVIDYKEARNQ